MPPTQATEQYFNRGLWGWLSTTWVKLALVWGYTDRWYVDLSGTQSGAGSYYKASGGLAAGFVYKVELVMQRNKSGARGARWIRLRDNSNSFYLAFEATPAQYVPQLIYGPFTMKAGDSIDITQNTCLDNDEIEAVVWGYKMRIT